MIEVSRPPEYPSTTFISLTSPVGTGGAARLGRYLRAPPVGFDDAETRHKYAQIMHALQVFISASDASPGSPQSGAPAAESRAHAAGRANGPEDRAARPRR